MDSGTIIIGIVSIALCVLPFVLMNNSRKKTEKKRLQALANIASLQHGAITRHDFCGPVAIGLDEAKNYVFFSRNIKNEETVQFVNLADIRSCQIVNSNRGVNSKDGEYKVIDKLHLRLSPADKNKSDIILEFYNADERMQMIGELQLAEKWEKIINEQLKNRNT